jgi:hypothetical protein
MAFGMERNAKDFFDDLDELGDLEDEEDEDIGPEPIEADRSCLACARPVARGIYCPDCRDEEVDTIIYIAEEDTC